MRNMEEWLQNLSDHEVSSFFDIGKMQFFKIKRSEF